MKTFGSICYTEEQRLQFKGGGLPKEWAEQYPEFIGADDIRVAKASRRYHFFEWLAAIVVFNATGHISLIEKWGCKNHKRKEAVLDKLLPAEVINKIRNEHTPDLLCYKPDFSDYFFVEVKGHNDKLRPKQLASIDLLEKLTGKTVYLLEIKKM
jgi:hypothetical protein